MSEIGIEARLQQIYLAVKNIRFGGGAVLGGEALENISQAPVYSLDTSAGYDGLGQYIKGDFLFGYSRNADAVNEIHYDWDVVESVMQEVTGTRTTYEKSIAFRTTALDSDLALAPGNATYTTYTAWWENADRDRAWRRSRWIEWFILHRLYSGTGPVTTGVMAADNVSGFPTTIMGMPRGMGLMNNADLLNWLPSVGEGWTDADAFATWSSATNGAPIYHDLSTEANYISWLKNKNLLIRSFNQSPSLSVGGDYVKTVFEAIDWRRSDNVRREIFIGFPGMPINDSTPVGDFPNAQELVTSPGDILFPGGNLSGDNLNHSWKFKYYTQDHGYAIRRLISSMPLENSIATDGQDDLNFSVPDIAINTSISSSISSYNHFSKLGSISGNARNYASFNVFGLFTENITTGPFTDPDYGAQKLTSLVKYWNSPIPTGSTNGIQDLYFSLLAQGEGAQIKDPIIDTIVSRSSISAENVTFRHKLQYFCNADTVDPTNSTSDQVIYENLMDSASGGDPVGKTAAYRELGTAQEFLHVPNISALNSSSPQTAFWFRGGQDYRNTAQTILQPSPSGVGSSFPELGEWWAKGGVGGVPFSVANPTAIPVTGVDVENDGPYGFNKMLDSVAGKNYNTGSSTKLIKSTGPNAVSTSLDYPNFYVGSSPTPFKYDQLPEVAKKNLDYIGSSFYTSVSATDKRQGFFFEEVDTTLSFTIPKQNISYNGDSAGGEGFLGSHGRALTYSINGIIFTEAPDTSGGGGIGTGGPYIGGVPDQVGFGYSRAIGEPGYIAAGAGGGTTPYSSLPEHDAGDGVAIGNLTGIPVAHPRYLDISTETSINLEKSEGSFKRYKMFMMTMQNMLDTSLRAGANNLTKTVNLIFPEITDTNSQTVFDTTNESGPIGDSAGGQPGDGLFSPISSNGSGPANSKILPLGVRVFTVAAVEYHHLYVMVGINVANGGLKVMPHLMIFDIGNDPNADVDAQALDLTGAGENRPEKAGIFALEGISEGLGYAPPNMGSEYVMPLASGDAGRRWAYASYDPTRNVFYVPNVATSGQFSTVNVYPVQDLSINIDSFTVPLTTGTGTEAGAFTVSQLLVDQSYNTEADKSTKLMVGYSPTGLFSSDSVLPAPTRALMFRLEPTYLPNEI